MSEEHQTTQSLRVKAHVTKVILEKYFEMLEKILNYFVDQESLPNVKNDKKIKIIIIILTEPAEKQTLTCARAKCRHLAKTKIEVKKTAQ